MLIMVLAGLMSGIISGLGIGGGTILIPALTIFFGVPQQEAQNINLIYFVPTAVIALVVHLREGSIEKPVIKPFLVTGVIGAVLGAMVAVWLEPALLRKIFGAFLIIMGAAEFKKKE